MGSNLTIEAPKQQEGANEKPSQETLEATPAPTPAQDAGAPGNEPAGSARLDAQPETL